MKYLILIILFSLINGCSNDNGFKPAQINYGEDICTACSMIISEQKYSAQYILPDGTVKKFDDIGCMIDYIKKTKDEIDRISTIYVRDFESNNWINAKNAYFIYNRQIKTPMGYGIIAFANDNEASNYMKDNGGKGVGSLLSLINR